MALSRLYFFVLPAYVAFSHSWLARALQVLAFYCSWSLSIPCLVSSSLSSIEVVLGGPLPGLSSFSLPPLSTSDFSIFLPRLHLHDLVDKICQLALRIVTPFRLLVSLLSVAQRTLNSIPRTLCTGVLLFCSLFSLQNVLVLLLMLTVLVILYTVYLLAKIRGLSLDTHLPRTSNVPNSYSNTLLDRILVLWLRYISFARRHLVKLVLLTGVIGCTYLLRDWIPRRSRCRTLLSSHAPSPTFETFYCRYTISTLAYPNINLIRLWNSRRLLPVLDVLLVVIAPICGAVVVYTIIVSPCCVP
ncbi:hypothetical protein BC629DRAFT_1531075 [Irpex lacteus]|nr:hypothetical protein BC629DRAFT_1531075 [Irpex lacteus]